MVNTKGKQLIKKNIMRKKIIINDGKYFDILITKIIAVAIDKYFKLFKATFIYL